MSEEQFVLIERRSRGIEIHVKVHPMVEEVIKSAMEHDGQSPTNIEAYGRYWLPVGATPVRAYPLDKPIEGNTYFLNNIGGSIRDGKNRVNISFLQLEGISKDEGVRILIAGPVARSAVIDYATQARNAIEAFLRDYLDRAKIRINISLTQQA